MWTSHVQCNASFVPVLCVHAPSNKSSRSTPPKATAAPLHPTPTNTCVRIRGTHGPQEYWQIADVHCSTFYGDSDQGSLLGQLLRLDRVMALNTGVCYVVHFVYDMCLISMCVANDITYSSQQPMHTSSTTYAYIVNNLCIHHHVHTSSCAYIIMCIHHHVHTSTTHRCAFASSSIWQFCLSCSRSTYGSSGE